MASIIIRNIEDSLKEKLRVRAAQQGRSMEEEVRVILRKAFPNPESFENIADLAESLFGKKGIDLDAHPAVSARHPQNFGE